MSLHPSTFEYLMPSPGQREAMDTLRKEAAEYAAADDRTLDEGPDKTYVLRRIRETAMWVNVALTRHSDGAPRVEFGPS